jgi:predicted anti-sigma-YlaC factor YlaD
MLTPVPPTDCARARESASARLDGELVELQAAQLEAHLRSCPDCRAYAAGIEAITLELRAAPLVEPAAPAFQVQQWRRRIGVIPAVAAAALVVAVAGSSFAVGGIVGREGSHVPPPATTQSSALGGSVDALVLPALAVPESKTVQVTAQIIAL